MFLSLRSWTFVTDSMLGVQAMQGTQSEMVSSHRTSQHIISANIFFSSGEEKPSCLNCQRQGEACDYSVRLNWGGRTKRASVDSPSSQSSGYAGTIISFADPVPVSTISPTSMPVPATSTSVDGFVNVHSGDIGSISPTTPGALGIFDSPKPPTIPEDAQSPNRADVNFSSTWPEQSPLTSPVTSGPMSHYPFSSAFHGSFSAAADQAVGLRSLSAFAFHSNPVSQPESFLRNSVDIMNHPSDQDDHQSGHLAQDEHGLGFNMNEITKHGQNSSGMSNGDLSAFLLGSHDSIGQPDTTSPPRRDRLTSFNGTETMSNDQSEDHHAAQEASAAQSKWHAYLTSVTDNYGLDCGRPDQDLAMNNDHAAIDVNSALDNISSRGRSEEASPKAYPTPTYRQNADYSGYYASPVPINIPRYLSPLPSSLLENPINLMYFHHFINHTSRMLVPHDCDNNPFMSVLPSSKSSVVFIMRAFRESASLILTNFLY